jgi:hypothetical protein
MPASSWNDLVFETWGFHLLRGVGVGVYVCLESGKRSDNRAPLTELMDWTD